MSFSCVSLKSKDNEHVPDNIKRLNTDIKAPAFEVHHVPSFSWQHWNKCNDSEDPAEKSKVKKGECWDAFNPVPLLLPPPQEGVLVTCLLK